MKYYKCWKCGESITEAEDPSTLPICTLPFPGRAVCAGAYVEITKEEYDKKVAEWERLQTDK